jgi:hypothetical protein
LGLKCPGKAGMSESTLLNGDGPVEPGKFSQNAVSRVGFTTAVPEKKKSPLGPMCQRRSKPEQESPAEN